MMCQSRKKQNQGKREYKYAGESPRNRIKRGRALKQKGRRSFDDGRIEKLTQWSIEDELITLHKYCSIKPAELD
jgi:hypothetical protein